jgi:hypothetical protein
VCYRSVVLETSSDTAINEFVGFVVAMTALMSFLSPELIFGLFDSEIPAIDILQMSGMFFHQRKKREGLKKGGVFMDLF